MKKALVRREKSWEKIVFIQWARSRH